MSQLKKQFPVGCTVKCWDDTCSFGLLEYGKLYKVVGYSDDETGLMLDCANWITWEPERFGVPVKT